MKQYLQFVWDSTIHPNSIFDFLPVIQLVLVLVCWTYIAILFVDIYKHNKQMKHGNK
jgi:hypothetical protein